MDQIIANAFASKSAGSVYFHTNASVNDGHNYGKLEPWSFGNDSLMVEIEGALTVADETIKCQKKATGHSVLWKKSKENGPKWASPCVLGRPRWHIEGSEMARFSIPL